MYMKSTITLVIPHQRERMERLCAELCKHTVDHRIIYEGGDTVRLTINCVQMIWFGRIAEIIQETLKAS